MVKRKQQGVVLIIALVFVVALTGVATALLQNSTTDLKMSGASEDKTLAVQEVLSKTDEVIFLEVNKINGDNLFAKDAATFPESGLERNLDGNTSANFKNKSSGREVECPHSKLAFSIEKSSCNILTLEVTHKYGRHKNQEIKANTGVLQVLNDGD